MRGVAEADAHPELTEGKEDAGHRGHTPDGESVLKLLSPMLPAPTRAAGTLREQGVARPCPRPARSHRSQHVWSQFGGHQLLRVGIQL